MGEVAFDYTPPAGMLGDAAARMGGADPSKQVDEALENFKQIVSGW